MTNLKKGDKVVHVAGVKGTIIRVTMVPIYTVRWNQSGHKGDYKEHDLRRVQMGDAAEDAERRADVEREEPGYTKNTLKLTIAFDSKTDDEANEFANEISKNIMDYEEVTGLEGSLNPEPDELDKVIAEKNEEMNRVFEEE